MTSRPAHVKRPSAAPAAEPAAKPLCTIHSLSVVADKAALTGSHAIVIGENSIVHPHARIRAEGGSVTIGKNTTISERAVVGVAEEDGPADVVIGDNVAIETGATVEAQSVGEGVVIDCRARIGKGAVIGKHCKIAPLTQIQPEEKLADYTVVYSANQRRQNQTIATNADVREGKQRGQAMHVELLKQLIPDASSKWR